VGGWEQTLIRIEDRDTFAHDFAHEPVAVPHSLVDHPLLTLEAIAELADTLPRVSVERHLANLLVLMPGGAPELEGCPSDTVSWRRCDHPRGLVVTNTGAAEEGTC